MDYRSPFEPFLSFLSGHDKPVKQALYNALALFALFLCCAAFYALHVILAPFIKPLIWALLVGSVLHPFKCSLAKRFRCWFDAMEETGTPIFIGIFFVPINILNDLSEVIGSRLLKYIKYIVSVAIVIPLVHIVYYYTPRLCICLVWKLATYSHSLISFFINNITVTSISVIIIGYFTLMYMLWSPQTNKKFHWAAIGVWLLLSCFFAHQFGSSFQTPIFIALQIIIFAGFIYEVYDVHEEMIAEGHEVSIIESLTIAFHTRDYKNIKPAEKEELIKVTDLSSSSEKLSDEFIDSKPELPVDTDSTATDSNKPSISSTSTPISTPVMVKKNDPWSLDLFENSSGTDTTQSSQSNRNRTDKIKTASQPSSSVSDIYRKNNFKFRRSNSQPQVSQMQSRSLLGFGSFNSCSQIRMVPKRIDEENNSSMQCASVLYLYSLLWICAITFVWKNLMILPVLIIPIVIYIIKRVGIYLGLWNWLYRNWCLLIDAIYNWCYERYDAFVPLPIRGVYKVIHMINQNIKLAIKGSIDTVASSVVILALLIFVICASVFVAIQIYTEAIMLVQMTSNVINQTVVHNPELRQILPPSFDDTVDSILDNAYQYGREGISTLVRGMMSDVDSAKSAKLEKQVLELWDRLYQTWMSSDDGNGPKVTSAAVQSSWDAFIDDIQKSPEMFNINGITEFVKQNIGTFISLMDSVWSILKGNISLVMGSFSAFVSVLLGGGTAVLNFILNVIVFLTTLFYLLNSSGDLYKPVELMTNFSSSGNRFGLALEAAITGVFTATFKLAAFYGLWTWLIHNWFNVKIVYLPSALATILGAVPFLGTYWACIPAVLDLWLAQDKGFQALLFAGFQFLPTSIVDTTIYNEIQGGGHPYLTGLAIAGGIFCLGVEGAILGPLLLCALYVIIDLSSSLFKDSPSGVPIDISNLSRLEIQRM